MENRRFVLFCLLGVVLFLLYQTWQKDYPPALPTATPALADPARPGAEPVDADVPTGGGATPAAASSTVTADFAPATARVRVATDVMTVEIALLGGDLRRVELIGYPLRKNQPDQNVPLLDDRDGHWFVIQSGLTSASDPIVTQKTPYRSAQERYELAAGQDALEVTLEATSPTGLPVQKTYRFRRASYEIGVAHAVTNAGAAELEANHFVQLWRTPYSLGDEPPFIQSFLGIGVYERKKDNGGYKFRKIPFDDLDDEPYRSEQSGGWLAFLQHYFFAAVIPPDGQTHRLIAKPSQTQGYVAQYIGPGIKVAPGAAQRFEARLYVGPIVQRGLDDIAPGLDLTIDYGILKAVAAPLFFLLNWFHKATGNWGFAIILLTLVVKLLLYKLSEAQYRSMAKMRKFAPRIQELKERHGDDRERLHKAMMELYKKEKFNPLAGCWPLLIQFPVFIALYWVLLDSVELRQADFALWLNDLSAPDKYYVLPVLFGVSMWVQQKLSGQTMTMDPMQQRVMNAMPIMLTAFFAFFPAGLVLYWFVSNLTGIAQQWYITRKLDREGLGHR